MLESALTVIGSVDDNMSVQNAGDADVVESRLLCENWRTFAKTRLSFISTTLVVLVIDARSRCDLRAYQPLIMVPAAMILGAGKMSLWCVDYILCRQSESL